MTNSKLILLVLLLVLQLACAVYLPGIPRRVYKKGDEVNVKTRKLSSIRNLPFDFYRVKFCKPKDLQYSAENLGEYLFGDRIENSVYKINFLEEVTCQKIQTCLDEKCCDDKIECPESLTKDDIEEFKHKIEEDYIAELIIDNLPVANRQDSAHNCGALPPAKQEDIEKQEKYTRPDGYPIGCKMYIGDVKDNQKSYFINNHISFVLRYHEREGESTIVGVEAFPTSIDWADKYDTCKPGAALPREQLKLQLRDETQHIPWSYSVHWAKSDIRWASRWDNYLTTADSEEFKIHWFSIVNSLMIVLFLTGMVAMIMMRVLHKDIAYYNRADNEDPADETGWKLVHADVFRSPFSFSLLSVLAGSGAQVFAMVVITLVFALLGFLSPANRGSLATVMVLLFVFMGIFAGYYALRFYKMFGGVYWKTVAIATAFFFPGVVFAIFFGINFVIFVAAHSSTGAIPFTSLLSIMAMWFGVSVPLVFTGSYFGWRQEEMKPPVAAHRIPRQIPDQPLYMRGPVAILMGGILPFGAVFIELYFIMSSLWLHKFYIVFGFLFLVFVILVLTSAEITIVMTYFQLCNEDYRWWWRSYLTSGSSALYLFLYSVFYYATKLHVDSAVMGIVFFGYMSIVSFFFFVLTGSIGFFATFAFVRKIYSSIKVD